MHSHEAKPAILRPAMVSNRCMASLERGTGPSARARRDELLMGQDPGGAADAGTGDLRRHPGQGRKTTVADTSREILAIL